MYSSKSFGQRIEKKCFEEKKSPVLNLWKLPSFVYWQQPKCDLLHDLVHNLFWFEYLAFIKRFLKLGGCLWLLVNACLPKTFFVPFASWKDWKTVQIVGNKFVLFRLKALQMPNNHFLFFILGHLNTEIGISGALLTVLSIN